MNIRSLTVAVFSLAALTFGAAAGPLNPPAGAVGATMKTLSEVEPRVAVNAANTPGDATAVYIISQPGSYYLTGNVAVPAGKSGVRIAAKNVHLDLSGFAIKGVPGSLDGVVATGAAESVRVHNGSVLEMGRNGVDVSYNLGMLVKDVTVRECVGTGIDLASGSVAESCTVAECVVGINAGAHCVVRSCASRNNSSHGISLNDGSIAEACAAGFNNGHGFRLQANCVVRGCAADTNFSDGFNAFYGATLSGCSASSNSNNGISAGQESLVESCNCDENGANGVEAGQRTVVRGCLLSDNTNAGVLLTAVYAAAEGNDCRGNSSYGIRATSAGCLVVKNVVTGGGGSINFALVAGTRLGAVVNAAASGGTVSVSPGASASGSFSTTDPNSNLSY